MSKFLIQGGKPLHGTVKISGSKNAALPIIAASILTDEKTVLDNVPNIVDVHNLLKILKDLGVKSKFRQNRLEINPENLRYKKLDQKLVNRMRASILLLGPMLARFHKVNINFPGGCVLGKRPVDAHLEALKQLGAKILEETCHLNLQAPKLKGGTVILPEISVTATENAVMAAVLAAGKTEIHLAACEPHVQDLCRFLNKMGAKITGIGTNVLKIKGVAKLKGVHYQIVPDYLETGTLSLAAVLTGGQVTLTHTNPHHLDIFFQKLKEAGAKFKLGKDQIRILKTDRLKSIPLLKTAVYPGFPTDLQAPFAVLLTQAEGQSEIFETLFEGRLNYLFELEKMGAKVNILNPHRAEIEGLTELEGTEVASCDLRAGAAMVMAALIARGKTEIGHINYIDRGYEKLDEKLRKLGAEIKRI